MPWQGDINKYHTTWSGQQIALKCVVQADSTSQIWYKWNFGDGSESAISSLSGKKIYNVEITHTYTGAVDTPFTAKLLVADNSALANSIQDPYLVKIQAANLDGKVNVAIDNGLWYLYKLRVTNNAAFHTFDGSQYSVWSFSSYFSSPTASAVQAFEINGHKETGNPNEDPYVEAVQGGLNWLFNGYYSSISYPMLQTMTIGLQSGRNPDTNGNGKGIQVRDYGSMPGYQGGMVMDAIISSGTPDADSGRDFDADGSNETYREVIQDMADMYGWGQYDGTISPYGIVGGWRYSWNTAPDNSVSQWGAIGMLPAEEPPWNIAVPSWVKNYNNNWLNYSFNTRSGHPEWGGFGYTDKGIYSPWDVSIARTPSGMVQLIFAGMTTTDTRWEKSERWIAQNWGPTTADRWLDQNNIYAYYAFAKAMRLAKPEPVVTLSSTNFDWYRGDGITTGLAQKVADRLVNVGKWDLNGVYSYGEVLGTSWSVIILRPVVFYEAPIACFDANPNPNYPNLPINFNPLCSGHSQTGKDINNLVSFEWDWDNNGVYDESKATPQEVTHSFSCPTIPCTYPVQLRVTDDSVPARTATYIMNILITNPPHPPVSRLNGPYMITMGDSTLTLDGSNSYDPNEGTHEEGCDSCPNDGIKAWEWDLGGAPFTYTDKSGEKLTMNQAEYSAYFGSPGTYDIGLRVKDNTKLSYPASGDPDLTDEDFAVVKVYDSIAAVSTGVGCNYVTLSWNDIGAEKYYTLRSTEGPNVHLEDIGSTTATSKTMGSIVMGVPHWYRIFAEKDGKQYLSNAVEVNADKHLCDPIANAGGPYEGNAGEPVTLDGSGSKALTGVIVTWEWDLDNDGVFDDALGEKVQWTWNAAGNFPIRLQVTSSDSLVLTHEAFTNVEISASIFEAKITAPKNGAKIAEKPAALDFTSNPIFSNSPPIT